MTPRPIHRWKSFWLGILVLISLAWSWSASQSRTTIIIIQTRAGTLSANQGGGYLVASYIAAEKTPDTRLMKMSMDIKPGPRAFPPAFLPNPHGIRLAHWFVILLFLIPWLTFLARRWWRMKRLTNPPAQLKPAP